MKRPPSIKLLGAFFLLYLSLFIFYLPSLPGPKMSDDVDLTEIPQLQMKIGFESLKTIFTPGSHIDYYPIRDLSYLLDVHAFGDSPLAYRIHQLVLMFLLMGVLYLILRTIDVEPWPAFVIIALWALSPSHAEVLMWISGRKDMLALLFGSLATLLFLKGVTSGKDRWLLWALFFMVISFLSKASLTLLPFMGLLASYFGFKGFRRKKVLLILVVGAVIGLYWSAFQGWFYTNVNNMTAAYSLIYRLQASAAAFAKMVGAWFYDGWNLVDFENGGLWLELNRSFLPWGFVLWGLFIGATGLLAATGKRRWAFILAGGGLFYLNVSGLLFPHRSFFSQRYLEPTYLVLFLGTGTIICDNWNRNSRKRWIVGAGLALTVLFALGDYREGQSWSDPVQVSQKAVNQSPASIALKTNLLFELRSAFLRHHGTELAREYADLSREVEDRCFSSTMSDKERRFCRRYYYFIWSVSLSSSDRPKAQIYLKALSDSYLGDVDTKQTLPRKRFEDSLARGEPDLGLLNEWRTKVRWFPSVPDRIQNWVVSCYLDSDARAEELLGTYFSRRLLDRPTVIQSVKGFAPEVRMKLASCTPKVIQ